MELRFRAGTRNVAMTVAARDGKNIVSIDGRDVVVDDVRIDERSVTLSIAGRRHRVLFASERGHVFAAEGGHAWEFVPGEEAASEQAGAGAFEPLVSSPMPGKVLQVLVAAGDIVEADGALLLLEAMKMEMTVRATHRCCVASIRVEAGAMVGPGDTLVELEEAPTDEAAS
ncbi:MAG TPA: acetyl-CoA carboxylase biotin carboxyl carrier protein subunit [Candidatus Binatia bacterium]|jgi:biotin carboxyl carrier protein